ncbi:oligosaccharide flippase family protein [Limosilactobacillus reuteri]|nr:oligosaccharide flippase family protein [Limosilactobacillus reuteri]MCC4488665.1 oligosaccharide flippase family protein [Limosilactobacillus reuteri]MCC4493947.1 oligosaccharide flippase family protein [Limosilactobacillus reuteri]MCC4496315.1 oligosaccharide flippase family protein [Limosilactobacillus reuteri]
MLYIMNIAQLILPLITLPYLTRVLTVNGYGVVNYVKSLMMYITLIIEFGFTLSGTKEIVEAENNKDKINQIISKVTISKTILSVLALIVLIVMIFTIPLLRQYPLYTILSFLPSFLTIYLFDYFFRGIEKMQIITERYVIMRGTATALTFLLVKSEDQLLLIPILDIIGSVLASVWVLLILKKMGIHFIKVSFSTIVNDLKVSFTYFVSNIASTAFGALNTLFVGIILSTRDIAYWSLIMTLVTAVQSMYSPISDGIYPRMVAKKSFRLFAKILLFFAPFLILGATITYFGAPVIIGLVGGSKYYNASIYLQQCVPLLIVSFFSILCGWPLLGAINKVRETTLTTIFAAILQVLGLALLIVIGKFNITTLIILRTITEVALLVTRIGYSYKYRKLFNYSELETEN